MKRSPSAGKSPPPGADYWQPTAEWPAVRLRADLLRRAREFFYEHQFLEVETPLLSAETIVDAELEPIAVTIGESEETFWLQTFSGTLHEAVTLGPARKRFFRLRADFARRNRGRCTTWNLPSWSGIAREMVWRREWIFFPIFSKG